MQSCASGGDLVLEAQHGAVRSGAANGQAVCLEGKAPLKVENAFVYFDEVAGRGGFQFQPQKCMN